MHGDKLALSMSGKYMIEGLKQVKSDNIRMKFNGAMRPFTINSMDNIEEFSLILPVRTY